MNKFDEIEIKIKEYRKLSLQLNTLKQELVDNREMASELRKNFSKFEKTEYNDKIKELNNRQKQIKDEISEIKKRVKVLYLETETAIFNGINEKFSEVYEKQLSRLYGYSVEIIVFEMGDDFDAKKCYAEIMVCTRDRRQHGKILSSKSFTIVNRSTNVVEQKSKVTVCYYTKKHKAGEALPFDYEIFS